MQTIASSIPFPVFKSEGEPGTFETAMLFHDLTISTCSRPSGPNANPIANHCTVVFDQSHGEAVAFSNRSSQKSRFVLIAGKPIGEPVSQWGPFVMTTKEEVEKAMRDFKRGLNGFERAKTWVSEAKKKEMGISA